MFPAGIQRWVSTALGMHRAGDRHGHVPSFPPQGPERGTEQLWGLWGPSHTTLGVTGLVRDHHSHAQETCTRRRKRRTKRKGYRTDLFPLQGQGEKREVKKRGKSSWILEEGSASASGRVADTSFSPRFLMFSFLALTKSKSFPYSSLWERARLGQGCWGAPVGTARLAPQPTPTSQCC